LAQIYQVTGVGATLERLTNPPIVELKEQLGSAVRPLLQSLPEP
jgi:hypothetical protein